LSTADDRDAGADVIVGSDIARWVCAQTTAPAITAIDMTTTSRLIRSPFADSQGFSFLDDARTPVAGASGRVRPVTVRTNGRRNLAGCEVVASNFAAILPGIG
jgi:hypothetical protein